MINKLRKKIFWIIQISFSIIVLSAIVLYSTISYRNMINSSNIFVERIFPARDGENNSLNNDIPQFNKENSKSNISIEGMYSFEIKNQELKSTNSVEYSDEILNYAKKLASGNKRDGIIGDFVYKVKKVSNDTYLVTLVENSEMINHIKILIATSIIGGIISIFIIGIIAKKISIFIVRPVEETFEKQKQFISDASHELKTPLAVIEANTEVLENSLKDNKWIKYIQNEVESMNKLVNDLLTLARTENSSYEQLYNNINISDEVQFIVSSFDGMAYEKNIKINRNITKEIKYNCDKEDIKRIVSILLDNAIKYTFENKEIEVNLMKQKNEIIIEVINEGNPIPKEEQDKIFERFYRVDKSRNRNEKRYGLGLAIAKSTIQKYNGDILVNCNEGKTKFKIVLPE